MHLLPPYNTVFFHLSLSPSISSTLPSAPSPQLAAPKFIQLPKLLEDERQELQQDRRELQQKDELSRVRTKSSQLSQRLDTAHTELRRKNDIIEMKDNTIKQREAAIQEKDAIIQRNLAALQERDAALQERDARLRALGAEVEMLRSQQHPQACPHGVKFWQVSLGEVQVREDRVLGRGAWGVVCEGYFRGQRVAVKCVHPDILLPHTHERIRREITTMAQVRHPNLVLFVAAVLDDRAGPKIVTELLDCSLRSAYEEDRLGNNKPRILRDVASAMNYLHCQREPIVHRDLSSANVLMEAMAGKVWRAKVSDFGSANLVRQATTLGEGAIVYTPPECFPRPPGEPRPAQTPKIDVYSYGVLLIEVMLGEFPDSDNLGEMLMHVSRVWPALHHLAGQCLQWEAQRRPTMSVILTHLDRMEQ